MIKAINTKYKGYYFRSRLEARWGVYFDTLEIEWEYEKEGFHIKYEFEDGTGWVNYLPDFWLPHLKMWAEVKASELSDEEIRKAKLLVKETGYPLLMLVGVPERKIYYAIEPEVNWEGEYILSNYHNYPKREGRFYSMPYGEEEVQEEQFDDIDQAVEKARSKRFEFEEEEND